jgi:hypothetical protein
MGKIQTESMEQFVKENFEHFFFAKKNDIFGFLIGFLIGFLVGGGGYRIHITRSGKCGIGMYFVKNLVGVFGKVFSGFCKIEVNMERRGMALLGSVMGQKLNGKLDML